MVTSYGPSGIVDISTVVSSKVHPVVNEFADNQWILSWEDDRNGNSDIYAQNVQLDGSLGPYDPQEGTIEGMVALIGGTASVTQVEVLAGEIMTHPDATGFYSMVVPSGTYAVTGNLGGYLPDTVQGVVVVTGQTTSNVDLTLQALPTGFITGTVVLNGGNGNVTETQVTAGYHTVYPDAQGNYSIEIEIGTYDVTAALAGYVAETSTGIVVIEGMTTVGVDFELSPVPTTGFIDGMVVLQDGGDVSQVNVTAGTVTDATLAAGGQTTHPSANGYYFLALPEGSYTVNASHPYTLSDSITDVPVVIAETTENINFELEIVRADLVCKAVDTYNNILNNVDVEINGPEGVYNGTITNDSLIFDNVPYGPYNGTAWMEGEDAVSSNMDLGEFDHDIIFVFDLTGLKDDLTLPGNAISVSPNPFSGYTSISVNLNDPGVISLKIYSQQGQLIRTPIDGQMEEGIHHMTWNGKTSSGKELAPGIYTVVLQTSSERKAKVLVKFD